MNKILLLGALCFSCLCNAVLADVEYKVIVAVVNGDVITSLDLEERLKLAIFSMGGSIDEKSKKELRSVVLRDMINERIKKQHTDACAARIHLKNGWVLDSDVEEEIQSIAKRSGLTVEGFRELLKSKGINPKIVKERTKNEMSWAEYIRARFSNKTVISQRELTQITKEIKEKMEKESFYVYRMFFPFLDSDDERNVLAQVNNLHKMLLSGTKFENIARQFSKGYEASNGGELGWIFEGQLPLQEMEALKEMQVGSYKVVKSNGGYAILYLKDKKAAGLQTYTNLEFVEVIIPFGEKNPVKEKVAATLDYMNELKKASNGSCSKFIELAKKDGYIQVSEKMTTVLEAMQPQFRTVVEKTPVGGVSEAIVFDEGVVFFCLLSKKTNAVKVPTENEIRMHRIGEKLNSAALNELNNLRRKSHIDLKYESGRTGSDI